MFYTVVYTETVCIVFDPLLPGSFILEEKQSKS